MLIDRTSIPDNTKSVQPLHFSKINIKSGRVNTSKPPNLKVCHRMIKTCLDYGGIGLAAPQIGIFERMFVVSIDKEHKQWKVYFNPMWKYNLLDKKLVSSEEGCLSVPGKIITVSRYSEITASYETWENGLWTRKEEILSGDLAIVYQHEDDHLRATSIVDKLGR